MIKLFRDIKRSCYGFEPAFETSLNGRKLRFFKPTLGDNPDIHHGRSLYVAKKALSVGLRPADGFEVAHFLNKVLDKTHDGDNSRWYGFLERGLYVCNTNLWTPKSWGEIAGVYVQYDSQAEGVSQEMSINKLEKELHDSRATTEEGVRFSEDRRIAFAPLSTIVRRERNPENNGLVIANLGGKKEAETFAKLNKLFKLTPSVEDYTNLGFEFNGNCFDLSRSVSVIYSEVHQGYGRGLKFDGTSYQPGSYVLCVEDIGGQRK
jgi:hypothetical protein